MLSIRVIFILIENINYILKSVFNSLLVNEVIVYNLLIKKVLGVFLVIMLNRFLLRGDLYGVRRFL